MGWRLPPAGRRLLPDPGRRRDDQRRKACERISAHNGRIGAKTSIFIGLAVYVILTISAYYMKTERDFYILALMVASIGGFQTKPTQEPFHPAEKLDSVQQWVQPTVGDAVMQIKRRGMMFLVM